MKDGPLEIVERGRPSDSRTSKAGGRDVQAGTRRVGREEAWVAKLPGELQSALRAQSEREPPRGYEERLRRYFESIDR